jgi:hypothetical protein
VDTIPLGGTRGPSTGVNQRYWDGGVVTGFQDGRGRQVTVSEQSLARVGEVLHPTEGVGMEGAGVRGERDKGGPCSTRRRGREMPQGRPEDHLPGAEHGGMEAQAMTMFQTGRGRQVTVSEDHLLRGRRR